jgi:hypothetical protein
MNDVVRMAETRDSVNEFMRNNREAGPRESTRLVAAIECRDGFYISVQGHRGGYSSPRANDADYYSHVECGYPSAPVPELAEYKDGDRENRASDTESVYGYVPVNVVADLLNAHGGIKGPHIWPEVKP